MSVHARQLQEAREALIQISYSGVEFNDERIDYVVVQVDRELWEGLKALRAPVPAPEGQ